MLCVKVTEKGDPCELPITLDMLRRRFPQIVFPAQITDEILNEIGYAMVPESPAPERVPGHATVPDIPVRDSAGNIERTFRFVPYTDKGLEKRMNELRAKRNKLLSESDWTQSEDVQAGMTALNRQEWIDYRAALRNMTEDFEDPNIVVFPKIPADPILPIVDTLSATAAIKRRIAAKRMDVQGAGMTYLFPDGTEGTIQTRNSVDIQNIMGQAVGAIAANSSGDVSIQMPFRDEQNITHMLNPVQMLQMAMAALNFVSATYANKWSLEQQLDEFVSSGATKEQIMAFDINVGW